MDRTIITVPILSNPECKVIYDALNCFLEKALEMNKKALISTENYQEYSRQARNIRIKLSGLMK